MAPNRARPSASARPKPAAAPVTTATFPDRSVVFVVRGERLDSVNFNL
ncbi:Uncharacterised protein [Mycobacterium tuberculosis]|uniref:Uncharacterized protein n=1 Tax=Mycobacterium tuberculosis TaxID=1773 RepID=A0A655JS13_MYCTX|nr:Uncharacterised protein [Mycobacterium tuberculosis]COX61991.1 Uncharacterised protein [Mycobacterium tuberculosis]COX96988.1 Uncharacterised protein [Mycobacterium tuberculosis]